MNRFKQLIGEGRAIFAFALCLLSLAFLAPSAWAAEKCTSCITFSADAAFGIKLVKGTEKTVPTVNLEYSTDQETWTKAFAETGYDAKPDGGVYKIHFRGSGNSQFSSNIYRRFANSFTNTVDSKATAIACSGNVMTLLDWETVSKGQTVTMGQYTFLALFCGFTSLTAAPELPAETMIKNCYRYMFQDCTSLAEAPSLPAKTLAQSCYQGMFQRCTSLKTPPELPAANLAPNCYEYMFMDCTSLTTVPELPGSKLETLCYEEMFRGCKSLTTIPDLNVSALTNLCCFNMFSNCLGIVVNMTGPGREWKIPDGAVIGGTKAQYLPYAQWDDNHGRNYWASNMFANTSGTLNTAAEVKIGQTYYIASAPTDPIPYDVTAPAHTTIKVYSNDVASATFESTDGTVASNWVAVVVYTADEGWFFADGATAVTNKLDTLVSPAVDKSGKPPTAANWTRTEVTTEMSPYVLEEGKTYTAMPAKDDSNGGVFMVAAGATLTGKDVTFTGNSAYLGGAICNEGIVTLDNATFDGNTSTLGVGGAVFNCGTVNLDGAVTLKTASDTFANVMGTLNWNLADGKAGQLNGYDKLGNEGGTFRLTVDETTALPAVIATGDFSDVKDKDTFVITNASSASSLATTITIGGHTAANGYVYSLALAEDFEADPPTTNLVLTAVKVDLSHVIVDSTLPGGYKLGDDIPDMPGFYYGINYVTEMPEAGLLAGTETLEIAGSAAITNAVALKSPAKLVLHGGATLSIMGEDVTLSGLDETGSIDGQGAIYLDKDVEDAELKTYTDKLVQGCGVTVARASVTDDEAKQTTTTEGDKTYYDVVTSAVTTEESQETNAVVTADIVVKGEDDTDGIILKTDDEKPLVVAGSVTADATTPQTLKLVKEQAADLVVNGKVRGFETVTVENKNAEGKMTTTSTLAANKDITILNEGHLEAKAQAGANLYIKNTTANTLIGEYAGQNVTVTNTATGVAQDIVLQAYGTDAMYGKVTLVGEDGSVYSNAVIVAGKNATPEDLSANDGSGEVRWIGTNTFSGSVVVNAKANGMEGESPMLRFANADAVMAKIVIPLEISGECNIRSTEKGTAKANNAITLKDGAVLGGNTRLVSTCFDNMFVLEGTVTMKDGAEISRTYAGNDTGKFEVPADATLKLQGATIDVDEFALEGTLLVESGTNKIKMGGTPSAGETMVLTLKKGASLEFPGFFNQGVINLEGGECIGDIYNYSLLNWDLAEGTTTLNWAKISNEGGTFRLTVGDAAAGTRYVLATNVEETVTETFTVTNSVAGGAAATVKAGGVCKVDDMFYALDVSDDALTLTALAPAKLSDVEVVDKSTDPWTTNATAGVKVGGYPIAPNADGTYTVPQGTPITVVYTAAEGQMIGPGLTTKTVAIGELAGDTSLDDPAYAGLKPTTVPLWVKSRKVKIDLRERLVVAAPEDVLPIAYSTNAWGGVSGTWRAKVTYGLDTAEDEILVPVTNVNGYAEWTPEEGVFGKYLFKLSAEQLDGSKQTSTKDGAIYYTTYFPLTLAASNGGTYAATTNGAAATGSFDLLGYSYVNLEATPDAHYEFSSWAATTNGVDYADGFDDPAASVTRFEMPNSEATLKASFVWQSAFTEKKTVGEGEIWEVFEGDDYQQGLTNNGTVVWKPGVTNALGKASFLDDFGQLQNGETGKLQIVFDESLTNGTYKLANEADNAKGLTFEITNGTSTNDCTVVEEKDLDGTPWTYVGPKRFKLFVDAEGRLKLRVQSAILRSIAVAADPKAAGTASATTNGVAAASVYADTVVTVTATTNLYWQFKEWTGVDAAGKALTFAAPANAETTFTMPDTNASVTAKFIVSEAYKAETAQAISNAADKAIAAINAKNLSQEEKDFFNRQVRADRDAQVAGVGAATVPSAVAKAKSAADTAFKATKKSAQACADRVWAIGWKVAYTNIAGTVAVTNESQARLAVKVVATPKLHWQFANWTGVTGAGGSVQFSNKTKATTTFTMPETNVTVTANFIIDPAYRAEQSLAVSNAADSAIAAINGQWRLNPSEKDAYIAQIKKDRDAQVSIIARTQVVADIAPAVKAADKAFERTKASAKAEADGKPYDLVIAEDFSANPPFENWDEKTGTFSWNGQPFTVGKNAFHRFSEASEDTINVPFVTNVHVFGTQTIVGKPTQVGKWNLDLVTYGPEGAETEAVVTVSSDASLNLVNITQTLGKITGDGVLVLAKTEPAVNPETIYTAYIDPAATISVRAAGTEPKKESGAMTILVDGTSKVDLKAEAILLPGIENAGNVDVSLAKTTKAGALLAGSLKSSADVKIVNASTQELQLVGRVEGRDITVDNKGRSGTLEGRIVANSGIDGARDVTITNDAYFEADVTARRNLFIRNSSVNTLVGTYAGATVTLDGGAAGAISNVTFRSTSAVTMTGVNVLTGPFAIDAPSAKNFGKLVWDVKGGRRSARLADFAKIAQQTGASFAISVDADPVNGVYTLADNATGAAGKVFSVEGSADGTGVVTVGGGDVYVGAKAYRLKVVGGQLVFQVDYGKFAITYDAMGPYFAAGETTVVSDSFVHVGYSHPTKPVRTGYTFAGWYTGVSTTARKAAWHMPLCFTNEHAVFARWTAAGSVRESDFSLSADGTLTLKSGVNVGRNLVLPDTVGGRPVKTIGKALFALANYKSSQITNFVLGAYVTRIEDGAFNGVKTLKTVTLVRPRDFDNPSQPANLTIGRRAFAGTGLETVELPEGTVLGAEVFRGCSYLRAVGFEGDAQNASYLTNAGSFSNCGYNNGTGAIDLYATAAFWGANSGLSAAIQTVNPKVAVSTQTQIPLEVKSVGEPVAFATRMAVTAKADTIFAGMAALKPDLDRTNVMVWYWEEGAPFEQGFRPSDVFRNGDGSYTVFFEVPYGGIFGHAEIEIY